MAEMQTQCVLSERKLIPLSQTIVILDTAPVRELAHGGSAEWVGTFAEMAKDGYSFSLADSTTAELLTQARSHRIRRGEYDNMIGLLKTFLNPVDFKYFAPHT